MKRWLLVLVLPVLVLMLAVPAAVGLLARQAQQSFLLERNTSGAALPNLREPGWLNSRYGWTLDARFSRRELRHQLAHGPWLPSADPRNWGWLAGRLHFSDGDDGLSYWLGLRGQLAAGGRIDTLSFVDATLGEFRLEGLRLQLQQAGAGLAMDLNTAQLAWQGHLMGQAGIENLEVNLARSVERELNQDRLDLRLRAGRLAAAAQLEAGILDLNLIQQRRDQQLELQLELSADTLEHDTVLGRVQGRIGLTALDAAALARVRGAGAQFSDRNAARQAQVAALFAELPAFAQQRPELRVDGLRLQATDGSEMRVDARASLQPPRRMAIGTGWIAGMIEAEVRLVVDDELLQRLALAQGDPLRGLHALLREAIEQGSMLEQSGRWRLRLRLSDGRWSPLQE